MPTYRIKKDKPKTARGEQPRAVLCRDGIFGVGAYLQPQPELNRLHSPPFLQMQ